MNDFSDTAQGAAQAGADRRLLASCEALAQLGLLRSSDELAWALGDAMRQRVEAERCEVYLLDEPDGRFRIFGADEQERLGEADGLAAAVLHSGETLTLDRAGGDERFSPQVDSPAAGTEDRYLAVALTAPGEPYHGVLVATRGGDRQPFSTAEVEAVEVLALQATPFFTRHRLESRWREEAVERLRRRFQDSVFRDEALQAHFGGEQEWGDPLRLSSGWIRWGMRSLALVVVALAAFLFFGRASDRVIGEAMVRTGANPTAEISFPARDRFRLRAGMPVRLQLQGLESRPLEVRLDRLDDHLLTRDGRQVVRAEAHLPARPPAGLESYFDGARGRATVELGQRRLLHLLLPGLAGDGDGG